MKSWEKNISALTQSLLNITITDESDNLDVDTAYNNLSELVKSIRSNEKTMYFIGNGASASMSSHMAADFAKNARVHTQTFTDLALITAVANDISYDEVFSVPLGFRAQKGDLLVAISSSGNSPNILKGVKVARSLGMHIVTLSGMNSDNALRKMGDVNIHVEAATYGEVETSHAAILHYWKDLVD